MKCIVTAGPTYEELDQVRRMTNFSTGTLGTELANHLSEHGHEVVLLRGHYSTCRTDVKTKDVRTFTTTSDLSQQLKELASPKIGAVFHAAAVSDFGFGKIWRRSEKGVLTVVRSGKISTRGGTLLAELVPTPKIIGRLRSWFPAASIFGWKYEVEGGRARLVTAAKRQLAENRTDACVINGPAYGTGYGMVKGTGQPHHVPTKKSLFDALQDLLEVSG